jgi:hypothetical protein
MSRRTRVGLGAVLAWALAVRLVLALTPTLFDASDAFDYRRLGLSLASHATYEEVIDDPNSPVNGIRFLAYRPPGYPALRAALFLFSSEDRPAAVANALLETLAIALAFALVRRMHGEREALGAAAALATYAIWVPSLATESLTFFLWVSAAYFAFREGFARERGLLLGLVLGWAILTRPTSIALVWIVPFLPRPERVRVGAWTLAATTLIVGGWIVRNWLVLGAPTLSTNAGIHMAISYDLGSLTDWGQLHREGLGEAQISSQLSGRVRDAFFERPGALSLEVLERGASFFVPTLEDCFELRMIETVGFAEHPAAFLPIALARALAPLGYVLGWITLVIGALRRDVLSRALLCAVVTFAVAHCLVSRVDIRLVAPVAPFLFLSAGSALSRMEARARGAVRSWSSRTPQLA